MAPVTAILVNDVLDSFEAYANLNERDCWLVEDKADITSSRAFESISLGEDILAEEEVQDLEAQLRDMGNQDARRLTAELCGKSKTAIDTGGVHKSYKSVLNDGRHKFKERNLFNSGVFHILKLKMCL